jgi:hypothetical protein
MGGMGFRDIELFNLALLARQAWQLLVEPETLSARGLQAVYFPGKDFLAAEVGPSPSRIWRAIMEGKEVLCQGLIRRIGTGEMTEIWDMNWLPRNGLLRPVTSCIADPPRHVSELIDQTSFSWDQQLLQQIFTPIDVEVITNIPLSTRRQEDFWAWHYEKSGLFSVGSAYRMLVHNRDKNEAWLGDRPSNSNTQAMEKEWSTIWKVRVPSKIKVFIWRLARQSIPSGDVLHHRNMAPSSACTICGSKDSWKHSQENGKVRMGSREGGDYRAPLSTG